jgi:hypothetical protein
MATQTDAIAAALRQTQAALTTAVGRIKQMEQTMVMLQSRPRSISEEIDAIPGRRIEYVNPQEITFTAAQAGRRGDPLTFQVSQDGPLVLTHYPMVLWRPSAPDTATDLGVWRPVTTFPLPTQQVGTNLIDLMYEIQDGGSQRNFQGGPRGPIFSRPDNVVPLPCPTLFAPNSSIQFFPTYNRILFNGGVATTAGILHVDLIGYRIVNL